MPGAVARDCASCAASHGGVQSKGYRGAPFMSLLVVEDNPLQAMMLQRALADRRFDVDLACDGEEALKLGDLGRYEVILLDLELPKIDGLTLLRYIRTTGLRVPVLVLSCHADVATRVEALHAGADDYICKPYHLNELLARIRALLRRPLPLNVCRRALPISP